MINAVRRFIPLTAPTSDRLWERKSNRKITQRSVRSKQLLKRRCQNFRSKCLKTLLSNPGSLIKLVTNLELHQKMMAQALRRVPISIRNELAQLSASPLENQLSHPLISKTTFPRQVVSMEETLSYPAILKRDLDYKPKMKTRSTSLLILLIPVKTTAKTRT